MTILQTNEPGNRERSREMYQAAPFGKFSYDRARFKRNLIAALNSIEHPTDKIVFDVGCGKGFWFLLFIAAGFKARNVFGLDQARSGLIEAQKDNKNVVEGDVMSLPVQDNVADVVFCNGVLHHTASVHKGFEELCRVTRPGGVILLSVYNVWNPYFFFVHRCTWILRATYWGWSRKVYYLAWGFSAPIAQVLSLIILRKFLKNDELRTLLMDQVFTPYAKLFSERTLKNLPQGKNVEFVSGGLHTCGLMRFAKYVKHADPETTQGVN